MKQLKVILEDLILFILVLIGISYVYPYGYPDPCVKPNFLNPLGIPTVACSLNEVSAPSHLFFL